MDCTALKKAITTTQNNSEALEQSIPIFDRKQYPLPDLDELLIVGWPKRSNIRARGILAISTLLGAHDFADAQKVSAANIDNRHYHHIYPLSLLEESDITEYNLALNCALITDKTNQSIGRKDPYEYLVDRYKWVGEDIVKDRLGSHLIPINELKTGSYVGLNDEDKKHKIKNDFEIFIYRRAELILKAVKKLTNGENISAHSIASHEKKGKVEIVKELIAANESNEIEFKATLRECINNKIPADVLEHSVFKNIAAFMNSNGGSLLIGVEDITRNILGLDRDYSSFKSEDKQDSFMKTIDNLLENMLGNAASSNFTAEIISVEGKDIALLTVKSKSTKPIWLKNKKKNTKEFYIRRSASAKALDSEETNLYIDSHW